MPKGIHSVQHVLALKRLQTLSQSQEKWGSKEGLRTLIELFENIIRFGLSGFKTSLNSKKLDFTVLS